LKDIVSLGNDWNGSREAVMQRNDFAGEGENHPKG
jgi:hypothetical protein